MFYATINSLVALKSCNAINVFVFMIFRHCYVFIFYVIRVLLNLRDYFYNVLTYILLCISLYLYPCSVCLTDAIVVYDEINK